MNQTRDFLSRRVGDLEVETATRMHSLERLTREHELLLIELEEAKAARDAVEALTASPEDFEGGKP